MLKTACTFPEAIKAVANICGIHLEEEKTNRRRKTQTR